MNIRKAGLDDIDALIKLRMDYLSETGGKLSSEEEALITGQMKEYLSRRIPDGSFVAVIAETHGIVASAAFLAVLEKPANPIFINGITAAALNVFTYPAFRRKGIASEVIEKIISCAKEMNVSSIELLATKDGRPLYEKMGFTVSKHTPMRLSLSDKNRKS